MQYEVEAIIGKRYAQFDRNPQYLVKWKNYPIEESSWEPLKNLTNAEHYIELYEIRHSLTMPISVVSASPQCQEILSHEDIDSPQPKSQKKLKNKQENKLERKDKKMNVVSEVRMRKTNKGNHARLGRVNEVKIMQTIMKGGKMYFKVWEEGRKYWRNRNYLLQFYPRELCDFYEYLILQRYQ